MNTRFDILWPIFALAAWTFCILVLMAVRRVRAAVAGEAGPGEYAFGESPRVPARVALVNRNYMNLLELPVLFYLACILAHLTGATSALMTALAWAYVALRIAHSVVHLSYNRVQHRLAVFAASNVALICMWVLLGWRLTAAG